MVLERPREKQGNTGRFFPIMPESGIFAGTARLYY